MSENVEKFMNDNNFVRIVYASEASPTGRTMSIYVHEDNRDAMLKAGWHLHEDADN